VNLTSTSDQPALPGFPVGCRGFSLLELLMALSLTVCVALAVAPLWTSLETKAKVDGDRAITLLQERVMIARLDRDVRAASAACSMFPTSSALIQAAPSQIVLLCASSATEVPYLVEWEVANGAIMRRRGPCPRAIPGSVPHSLYTDNKTMLENVASSTRFAFTSASGKILAQPISGDGLSLVATVLLQGAARVPGAPAMSPQATRFHAAFPVGR
jgi:prepilin-type N-terminal cleavage/methylation domain-containing protein